MARMNRPAPVEITYKNMRFLITHNPSNSTLNKFVEVSLFCTLTLFLCAAAAAVGVSPVWKCLTTCCDSRQELKKYGVTTVVRVCEATYDTSLVLKEGIQVLVSLTFKPPCLHDALFNESQPGVVLIYSAEFVLLFFCLFFCFFFSCLPSCNKIALH